MGDFVHELEGGYFARWEAVVRDEQGLPLSKTQRKLLGELLDFNDEEEEEGILYINEIPRPSQPWYELLAKIAPALLCIPLKTAASCFEVVTGGWPDLVAALDEHGPGLSLPEGAASPLDVVPDDLQHRLWIQSCCEPLLGIGQVVARSEVMSLADPEESWRVDSFVELLREHDASVRALGLTLEQLLGTFVTLPEGEAKLLSKLLSERLALASPKDVVAGLMSKARSS